MNAKILTLAASAMMMATAVAAEDSIYVCKDGMYESRLLSNELEINLEEDSLADSIVFVRPEQSVEVNFAAFAAGHEVECVYVRSLDALQMCRNTAMKNYAVSSSVISDVLRMEVAQGDTVVTFVPQTATMKKGLEVTLQYDGGKYLSMTTGESISRNGKRYVYRYAFDEEDGVQGNWMATIPSKVKMNMLTIPGTHDSATGKVTTAMAKCQSLTIGEQLRAGVRAFDLRPRYTSNKAADIELDNLMIYHGSVSTGVLWKAAMDTIVAYLAVNPSETVVVNMQKESASGTDQSATWRTSIRTYLEQHKQDVVQKLTATTSLGDCRGKILVISHNPYGTENVYYDKVYGALAASWGDNETFSTTLNYTNNSQVCALKVSDNYNATKTADKQGFVKANLDAANGDTSSAWYMTFTSVAWKLFGSNPNAYAKTHNAWLDDLLKAQTWKSRLGVIFSDFSAAEGYTPELVNDVIDHNHKYLY